jgi:hypothetical protein
MRTATDGKQSADLVAWGVVADGSHAALQVPGLDEDERGALLRQLRSAEILAGRGHVAFVEPPAPDNVVRLAARADGVEHGEA